MQFTQRDVTRLTGMLAAAVISALNMVIFVQAGGLFPGGIAGLTVLVQRCALKYCGIALPYSTTNILLNAFPVYIGFRYVGKKFTFFSLLLILLSSFLVDFFGSLEPFTDDLLLICVFGGIINALANSIALRQNASFGGTDFLAMYMNSRHGMDSWNMVFGINTVILCIAGLLFGWDKALYSIIFQFTSTQTLKIFYKKYQQTTLLIVTNKPDEICHEIRRTTGHGSTILRAEGAYKHDERDIVYSVVSAPDKRRVLSLIHRLDPTAFINAMRTEQVQGKFVIEREE